MTINQIRDYCMTQPAKKPTLAPFCKSTTTAAVLKGMSPYMSAKCVKTAGESLVGKTTGDVCACYKEIPAPVYAAAKANLNCRINKPASSFSTPGGDKMTINQIRDYCMKPKLAPFCKSTTTAAVLKGMSPYMSAKCVKTA